MSSGSTLQTELDVTNSCINKAVSDMGNLAEKNHEHDSVRTRDYNNRVSFVWRYDSTDKKYYLDVYVDNQLVRSKW